MNLSSARSEIVTQICHVVKDYRKKCRQHIANASLRIMKGLYFSIRDCKTLRRDCLAIGSRLRQTFVVQELAIVRGEFNIIWQDNYVTFQPYIIV